MKKSLATILTSVLGLALLAYSASRSVDFVMATLPPGQQVLAFFALAALDIGLVLWLLYFLHGATGGFQRAIGLIMVIIDLVGAIAVFTTDTLLRSGQSGMIATMVPATIQIAILGLSLVIGLNVSAIVFCHLFDPAARRAMAEQESIDAIESQALKLIGESTANLAAELAPGLANNFLQDTKSRYAGLIASKSKGIAISKKPEIVTYYNAEAPAIPGPLSDNGKESQK